MYLYYDKNLNLRTKIDHGEKIRQGSDFEIVLCLDNDFDFETNLNSITATIKYNGNKIGNDVISQSDDLEVFAKLYPNENTVDLIDGVSYWMYHFKFDKDPYTLNAGQITFNPTLTYVDENDAVYKTLTFGSAELFVEKTIGFGKQNINLTNNFYTQIREQLVILEAKKANRNELPDEEIIVVDGKPVLVSKEFIDLINNEQLNESLEEINILFDNISKKPTEIDVEVLGGTGLRYNSLKNTKWTLNDTIDLQSFVGKINLNFTNNFNGYQSINIIKRIEEDDSYVMLYDDTEVYTRQIPTTSYWFNTIFKNIEIIDGYDVENIDVIAWFENNGICTSTPNDSIKYSLILTGNNLTLKGTDGTSSTITLKYATKEEFQNVKSDVETNASNLDDLTDRVSYLEKVGTGEIVVRKFVINTVDDLTFDTGKQSNVYEGDLLASLTTVNGDFYSASELLVGDVVYNKQLNQPDFWISDIIKSDVDGETYAQVSILESENVALEDYLQQNDVIYVESAAVAGALNTEEIGTLTVKGVEYKLKTKKYSSSGTSGGSGLTDEQELLINNLVIESNAGYNAGTQRMVVMSYKNVSGSQATKGELICTAVPSVNFEQTITNGAEIGTLTVNGLSVKLYAPSVDLNNYYTKNETKEEIQEQIRTAIYNAISRGY